MNENISNSISIFEALTIVPEDTQIWLITILGVFLFSLVTVFVLNIAKMLTSNRRIVEFLPTLISTLGVLGTFYGITMGLLAFNAEDLDHSIPGLLDGLKTAFYTSLCGMIFSMILSAVLNYFLDRADRGVSDTTQAAATICKAVQDMSDLNKQTLTALQNQLKESERDRKSFYVAVSTFIAENKNIQNGLTSVLNEIKTLSIESVSAMNTLVLTNREQIAVMSEMKESQLEMLQSVGNMEESSANSQQQLRAMNEDMRHVPEILDTLNGMSGAQEEINEKVGRVKEIIHGEILEIEDSMERTNRLLANKFDEFSELLKKSNTEALVEVMKEVTKEFQTQMNALINKLIQENFDQLNQSVEKLNTWQQENKEMIASLTRQYKEMADNFENTSTSLSQVKTDTTQLVSEGGRLHQIVDALNQVIVQDEKFIQVTSALQDATAATKSNMESFDESTKSLNEWVRKQRHFVEGVTALIAKLEELDKIRDYGEHFWKDTKQNMEEGVSIIANGSKTLNTQLKELDVQFYNRLGATLSELDNCITKMVEQVNNRR